MTPVRLEPAALRSRVKHSTTEPLRSRKTAVSGSSRQLTLKKGAPGDQVRDLLCVQLASYLERGPLMWMMPLHLHVDKKSDYDDI